MRVQETNRLKAPDNACLQAGIKAVVTCLESQIEATEQQIAEITETRKRCTKKSAC